MHPWRIDRPLKILISTILSFLDPVNVHPPDLHPVLVIPSLSSTKPFQHQAFPVPSLSSTEPFQHHEPRGCSPRPPRVPVVARPLASAPANDRQRRRRNNRPPVSKSPRLIAAM